MGIHDGLYRNFVFNIITEMVPYVRDLQLRPLDIGPHFVRLEMPVHKPVHNHVNTAHAGALYTLMETVAGGVLVASYDIVKISVLLKDAQANYHRPGLGTLRGEARLDAPSAAQVAHDLEQSGRARPIVHARVVDADDLDVASGTFTYSLKVMG